MARCYSQQKADKFHKIFEIFDYSVWTAHNKRDRTEKKQLMTKTLRLSKNRNGKEDTGRNDVRSGQFGLVHAMELT